MNEVFISNFRKIIEQNLQIFKNSQSDLNATRGKSVEHIIAMTQKQLILLRPTVLLPRCEYLQSQGPDSSIHSTHSEFNGFPDYDGSKIVDVDVELCNQGNIASNIEEIKNIIETEHHEIPFIDVHSQTVEKLILLPKKNEKEGEKQEFGKIKHRRGRKKQEPEQKQSIRNIPLLRNTPVALQSSEEVLSYSFSPLKNLESEIFPQSKTFANKNMGGEEKPEIKKFLRTRKPVMSAGYYEAVEPSSKRKKKSKQNVSSTSTFENAPRDFLKIDTLPSNATASEVQINFPLSLPLKQGKYRICIDLDKINLPPGIFRTITKTPQKRPTTSTTNGNSNESVPAEKSDLVKYLEIFSSGCENQNFDGSAYGSPVNNNNNNNVAVGTVDFQDQTSGPQIGDIVILQPNQNCHQASMIGNSISMDSECVIITESDRQLISNQLDKDVGIVTSAPNDAGLNTTNASIGINTSSASAGPAPLIDGTQMEDFEFPIDIDYRLYEYIENGEIFNQTNTQPSQLENVVRSTSSSSINNTQIKPIIQQSNLNAKDTREVSLKRQPAAQADTIPAPSVKSSTLPELCENTNPAHSQKNASRRQYTFICKDVLDLSAQQAKGRNDCRNDNVMDLTVSSSYHESPDKEQEKVTTSGKNLSDLSRDAPQILDKEPIQRISLEEYQRRNTSTEKTESQPMKENTGANKKRPKLCDKDCVACQENCMLNNPLDYEFDEHSNNFELPSLTANKAGPSYNNFADQSPATKDSGIDSEDCGNKSTGKNSNVSLRGDSTPIYRSREEEEGLKSCHEIDDDALSIFINSVAGSPFYLSENNEEDDGCNSICEKSIDAITPPPPKISCHAQSSPVRDVTADKQLRVVTDSSSGSKKVFKIPKLMSSTLRSANAVHNTSVLNDLETNFLFPECSTSQTTSPDFCTKPVLDSSFTFTNQALVQSVEKNAYSRKDVIGDIFGIRPCFMYLAGSCQKPNCKFSHEIIDCNILRLRLSNVSNTTLHSGYSFISRNKNLFRLYFPAFCDTFSQRGDRKRLVGMIRECQLYQETAPFLKLIVTGFMKTGLSQVDATKIIIENFISSTTEAMNILVDLILDSDVTQFISTLESYVTNPRYKFKMEAIDKLAFKCNRTKHFDIIQLLLKIILFQLPKQEVRNFQSVELVKFLDMVRNSHMTKTVQNVYDSCINKNRPDTKFDELFLPTLAASSSKDALPSMPSLTPLPPSITSSLLNNFTKRL